ncbi:methyltransferase [Sneathiella sp. P13V-1]|uniref:class I SAM-dependent methyltransferase n=1 Tax=Sneathiella sp. P13V-1 TaxID=2697366 RepID=UPI00187B9822|nr:class I SAM-dependent methyltransferase [Sneathiella sp. P13V-1]MBE7636431.1 methyltransferase [Sneathiella sp. P13V-1]
MARGREKRDRAVKNQYEDFPYPPRNPEDERHRLITGSPSHLDEVNHYIYAGRRDYSKPFRALVAGGGTGDAVIMLAQQLADRCADSTVTYVDMSSASRKVVEARAKVRGLTNIEFHTASLLELPNMGFEPFDYIDCCGVLHHLEDPEEGLKSLNAVLKEDGGMGLMLYATLGRIGVYSTQRALKSLVGDLPQKKQVPLAKKFVDQLPQTNWLVRNPFVGDHKMGEDAAFFDLLLHPRDRSYLVPEVVDFLGAADMEVATFIEPVKYDPAVFLKDPDLIKKARALDPMDQAALAENITGSLKTHVFYVKKAGKGAGAAKLAPNMIPILKEGNPPDQLAKAFKGRKSFEVSFDGVKIDFPLPARASEMVALMDGTRTFADIQAEFGMSWNDFRQLAAALLKVMSGWNILWLKDAGAS